MQRAILTFTDAPGGINITLTFEPEISDETKSAAVGAALNCLHYVAEKLADK